MSSNENFNTLVLILGDFHTPQRAVDIPDQFKELITPGKVEHVLCTGNLGSKERLEWLQSLSRNVHVVQGDFDSEFVERKVIKVEDWSIGLVHGHQIVPWGDKSALLSFQKQLDVDLLVHGHTHTLSVESAEGKYFLNPGSATGAYSLLTSQVKPSFMLLGLKGKEASVFTYEIADGTLVVSKCQISKS